MTSMIKKFLFGIFPVGLLSFLSSISFAAENNSVANFVDKAAQSGQGMTLWQVLQAGGIVMIFLGILSMVMVSIVLFLLLKLNEKQMFPEVFTKNLINNLSRGKLDDAIVLCEDNNSFIATVCLKGLNKKTNPTDQAEGIEDVARSEVSAIWAQLNYLSEISQVAPMLGLLGTVLGMIQAFNTIAFDAAGVKPILLAGGVSKAMVTTAAGLSIAIITIVLYSLLRVRVQKMTDLIESKVSQIIGALTQPDQQN